MRIAVFDHADNYLFDLADADVFECVRTEVLNGEHSLAVTTTRRLRQSQRILMCDATGKWREYVVTGPDENHDGGKNAVGTYYCVWSVQHDLSTVYGAELRPGVVNPVPCAVALEAALDGTSRWTLAACHVSTTGGVSMCNNSAWERIADVVSVFGGELDALVTVDGTKVAGRAIVLHDQQGSATAKRRFDWGRDVTGIRRKPPEGACVCRVKPLGKGEESGDGYGRKITIAPVNGGVDYLRDTQAEAAFRLPNGSGGWEYPTTIAENGDMETPEALKAWGQKVLHDYTRPVPTYEANVLQYAEAGMDVQGVALGDVVHVVDSGFNPDAPLRLEARVVKIVTNELDPSDVMLTIGQIGAGFADRLKALGARMGAAQEKLDAMWAGSGGSPTTAAYMSWLIGRMSDSINSAGGYVYTVPGYGIRTYDKAVSDPIVGAEASKAVAITSGGIMIANAKDASGGWDWKTLIESGRIASDLVTAVKVTAGFIGSPSGNYWNLDTGQVRFLATTEVGDTTIGAIAEAASDAETVAVNTQGDVSLLKKGSTNSVDVVYGVSASASSKPTSWDPSATVWKKGRFLWSRQKITMYDGEVKYSEPRLLANENGIGVKNAQEQWYMSTSKASPKGGSWATRQQSYVNGRYYFTRTRVEWSDGTVSYSPSANGELAQGFTSAIGVYDSMRDQRKAFNELTNNGKAQGFRTDKQGNLYFNATYIRSGVLADLAGRNYWNLNTGEFSLQALSVLEEEVSSIKVGGENLVDGTADWAGWKKRGNFAVSGDQANSAAHPVTEANQWDDSMLSPSTVALSRIKNKEVTVSFDVKCTGSWGTVAERNAVNFCMRLCDSGNVRQRWRNWQVRVAPTTSWQRVSYTFVANSATFSGGTAAFSDSLKLGIEVYNRSNKALQIRRVKVELGNVATDWSASSNDASKVALREAEAALKTANANSNKKVEALEKAVKPRIQTLESNATNYYNKITALQKSVADNYNKFSPAQIAQLDNSFNQTKIFNGLTDGGKVKSIRMVMVDSSGNVTADPKKCHHMELYVNADYIKSGHIGANLVETGTLATKAAREHYSRYGKMPDLTSAGASYWNLSSGYMQTYGMKAVDMRILGNSQFGSESGCSRLQIKDGILTGFSRAYKGGKYTSWAQAGFIDYAAQFVDVNTKREWSGLKIFSKGGIAIQGDGIYTAKGKDAGKTVIRGYTGKRTWLEIYNLHYEGADLCWKEARHGLEVINGIIVSMW